MSFGTNLARLRAAKGLTQEELAGMLYVTRQAVSRWERGETTPGIDMVKLIALVLDEPVTHVMEMPEHFCNSCGMYLTDPSELGTQADGSPAPDYCKWCYDHGSFTEDLTMEQMIERCAPMMVEHGDFTLDEAVSLLGAVLPHVKRWQA